MKECETAISEELSWSEIPTAQTKSTEQMKIILFDSVRCVAKICLVKKKKIYIYIYIYIYMLLQPKICHKETTKLRSDKASTVHVKHTYIVTAKENCCVSGLHKTRRNVEKHWRELRLTQTKTKLNIVLRNCRVKYGWIMVKCTENKSDEKTLMKMKKIQRDANEGAKYDTKN